MLLYKNNLALTDAVSNGLITQADANLLFKNLPPLNENQAIWQTVLSPEALDAYKNQYLPVQHLINYFLPHPKIYPLILKPHVLIALKNKIITSQQLQGSLIYPFENFQLMLSVNGIKAIEQKIFSLEKLLTTRVAVLRLLFTENGLHALQQKLFTIKNWREIPDETLIDLTLNKELIDAIKEKKFTLSALTAISEEREITQEIFLQRLPNYHLTTKVLNKANTDKIIDVKIIYDFCRGQEKYRLVNSAGSLLGEIRVCEYPFSSVFDGPPHLYIDGMNSYQERCRVGTALHEIIFRESVRRGYGGRVRLSSEYGSWPFHVKCGFRHTRDETQKLILAELNTLKTNPEHKLEERLGQGRMFLSEDVIKQKLIEYDLAIEQQQSDTPKKYGKTIPGFSPLHNAPSTTTTTSSTYEQRISARHN